METAVDSSNADFHVPPPVPFSGPRRFAAELPRNGPVNFFQTDEPARGSSGDSTRSIRRHENIPDAFVMLPCSHGDRLSQRVDIAIHAVQTKPKWLLAAQLRLFALSYMITRGCRARTGMLGARHPDNSPKNRTSNTAITRSAVSGCVRVNRMPASCRNGGRSGRTLG